ncbi:MAG: hypothetical protein V1800_10325 [Candidatus Latescibacterota bacterium]
MIPQRDGRVTTKVDSRIRPRDRACGTDVSALMEKGTSSRIRALFSELRQLADARGCGLYVVGGWPRDLLLNRPNWDIDLVVEGDGVAFAKAFASQMGGRVVSHARFRTATMVLPDGFKMDPASARQEHYEHPGALPEVRVSCIAEDLSRRDFTINSMAIGLSSGRYGTLLDPFGGRRDLKRKRLRVLHEGSFVEDPTRMMRAVRFEQRYGFRMEPETERLLRQAAGDRMLERVSSQRIREEVILLLREDEPAKPWARLDALGLLDALHPGLAMDPDRMALFARIEEVLSWFGQRHPDDEVDRWMLFFLGAVDGLSSQERAAFAARWNMPSKVRDLVTASERFDEVAHVLAQVRIPPNRIYRLLVPLSMEALLFLMARTTDLPVKEGIVLYLDRLRKLSLEISGTDLVDSGIPRGPIFRTILERVLEAKRDGRVHTRAEEWACACQIRRAIEKPEMEGSAGTGCGPATRDEDHPGKEGDLPNGIA